MGFGQIGSISVFNLQKLNTIGLMFLPPVQNDS